MSGLFTTLNSSVKALNAQSQAIDISGKNLANVNNASYARQRVLFGDRGTVVTAEGAQSLGLEALGIQQLRDFLLDKQVIRETGLQSSSEALQQAYQRAQASLGQGVDSTTSTGGSSGLDAALNNFFNSFQSLAASPTDTGVRQQLLQNTNILTDRLNQTDARLAQVQSDLDSQINTDVGTANGLLSTIADLNDQIARYEIGHPGSAVDLRDQRQAKLEELAKVLPVDTQTSPAGNLQLIMRDSGGTPVVLVDGSTVNGTVAFTGSAITAGSPATAVTLTGGSIQGALTARDGAVQTLRDNLDKLARQIVTSVNGAYNPSATPGADFFNPTGLTAGTVKLSPSLTAMNLVAGTGGAGDNTIALAVAGVATHQFSLAAGDAFDGSISQYYSTTVSGIGQSLATANTQVQDQTNITKLVTSQRDGVSGVSLDEEMADLVRYQRAYQASSRVFSIVNDLLDTVVNQLGH
jgi:flagellar hook-associated protein 1 FlgK